MARNRKQATFPEPELAANLLGLVQSCKDEPHDDGLRLILADYLEDHGESERAELIRLSLQRASAPALGRIARLQQKIVPQTLESTIRRGFLRVHANTTELRAASGWLAENAHWIEGLDFRLARRGVVESLVAVPAARLFSWLRLSGSKLRAEQLHSLAEGPLAGGLRSLQLDISGRKDSACQVLFGADSGLIKLLNLDLEGGFSAADAAALVQTPLAGRLRSLTLRSGDLAQAGVISLAQGLPGLQAWNFSQSRLRTLRIPAGLRSLGLAGVASGDALANLLQSPEAANLERLSLPTMVGPAGPDLEFLRGVALKNLRTLNLQGCTLTTDGIQALTETADLPRLETLDLGSYHYSRSNASLLPVVSSARWPALRNLSLPLSTKGPEVLRALAEGPLLSTLRNLRVSGLIDAECTRILAESPAFRCLESLEFPETVLPIACVERLARSTTLENLVWLNIPEMPLIGTGLASLLEDRGLPALSLLTYGQTEYRVPNAARNWVLNSPRRQRGLLLDLGMPGMYHSLAEITALGLSMSWE